jgi:VanZ family protein
MKWVGLWLPVLAWMAIIFLLSSRQRLSVSETYAINFLFFKTLHVIEYAVLFLLSYRACKYGSRMKPGYYGLVAFSITILYAMTDEVHQLFVPTREGHIRDVIIDGIGASLAWIFLLYILPRLPKQLRHLATSWQVI